MNQISDLKAMLYVWLKFFEKHLGLFKVVLCFVFLISMILNILVGYINFGYRLKIVFSILNLLLMVVILYFEYKKVQMISENRFELDERKRLITNLVDVDRNIYKVSFRRDLFEIEADGDALYTREMILEYSGVNIAWAKMSFSSTNQYGRDFKKMILNAFTYPEDETPLSRVPISTSHGQMLFAVILKNMITENHRSEGFKLQMKWKNIWRELFRIYRDDGILRIEHDTRTSVLEIIIPEGFEIISFDMPRTEGELVLEKTNVGKSKLQYTLQNLKKDDFYKYELKITKK